VLVREALSYSRGRVGAFALVGLVALAGCATTECDPNQGGFVRGVACTADGKYQVRQQEKQQTLSTEQNRSQDLQASYQATQAEQERVRRERQAAERSYAALQDELAAMRATLSAAKAENRELENEIATLESDIELLQMDEFTPDSAKRARMEQLRRRKDLLESEVEAVLGG